MIKCLDLTAIIACSQFLVTFLCLLSCTNVMFFHEITSVRTAGFVWFPSDESHVLSNQTSTTICKEDEFSFNSISLWKIKILKQHWKCNTRTFVQCCLYTDCTLTWDRLERCELQYLTTWSVAFWLSHC